VERAFAQAREAADACGIDLRLPRLEPRADHAAKRGRARCDWPWRGAYLSFDGRAMPCCMVSTPDRISLGNALQDGLAATFDNAAYRDFRERLDSDEPPEVCRSCSIYAGTF
jgi:radical SAM protein with 4Fe4S-binding SPASM domain